MKQLEYQKHKLVAKRRKSRLLIKNQLAVKFPAFYTLAKYQNRIILKRHSNENSFL